MSPDPKGEFSSPYLGMGNRPNMMIDKDGGYCEDADGNVVPCDDGLSITQSGEAAVPVELEGVIGQGYKDQTAGIEPIPQYPTLPNWEIIKNPKTTPSPGPNPLPAVSTYLTAAAVMLTLNGDYRSYEYSISESGSVYWGRGSLSEVPATDIASKYNEEKKKKGLSGSYTIVFTSHKKYHGKGYLYRAFKSALVQSYMHKTSVESITWDPASSSREGFKAEYIRMYKQDAIPALYPHGHENPDNYNIRRSPGYKYLLEDGQLPILP